MTNHYYIDPVLERVREILLHRLQPTCRLLADTLETAEEHSAHNPYRHLELIKYLAQQAAVDLELIQREAFDGLLRETVPAPEPQPYDSEGGTL